MFKRILKIIDKVAYSDTGMIVGPIFLLAVNCVLAGTVRWIMLSVFGLPEADSTIGCIFFFFLFPRIICDITMGPEAY